GRVGVAAEVRADGGVGGLDRREDALQRGDDLGVLLAALLQLGLALLEAGVGLGVLAAERVHVPALEAGAAGGHLAGDLERVVLDVPPVGPADEVPAVDVVGVAVAVVVEAVAGHLVVVGPDAPGEVLVRHVHAAVDHGHDDGALGFEPLQFGVGLSEGEAVDAVGVAVEGVPHLGLGEDRGGEQEAEPEEGEAEVHACGGWRKRRSIPLCAERQANARPRRVGVLPGVERRRRGEGPPAASLPPHASPLPFPRARILPGRPPSTVYRPPYTDICPASSGPTTKSTSSGPTSSSSKPRATTSPASPTAPTPSPR